VPHLPFADETEPDVLRLTFDPDSISLAINLNGAGEWFDLERDQLTARLTNQQLPPYSVLLLEVLGGDPTLSIRSDEAEECWRIIDPVLTAWADDAIPLEEYPAGSSGPDPAP
jgi:glucose-6-phosphate 1-dehydrogenase